MCAKWSNTSVIVALSGKTQHLLQMLDIMKIVKYIYEIKFKNALLLVKYPIKLQLAIYLVLPISICYDQYPIALMKS